MCGSNTYSTLEHADYTHGPFYFPLGQERKLCGEVPTCKVSQSHPTLDECEVNGNNCYDS